MKKFGSLLLALVVTLTMSFSVMTVASFAEETSVTPSTDVVVTVVKGEASKDVNLSKMKTANYKFSGINNYGTVEVASVKGVTLEKVLKNAGVKVGKKNVVEIAAADGKSTILTYSDIYGKRYCYTNATKIKADKGIAKVKKAKKKVVPVVLSLEEEDGVMSATLNFGQKYITERNKPSFTGDVATITVKKAEAMKAWDAPKFASEKTVYVGDTLAFDVDKKDSKSGFIFYTVNGDKPTGNNARLYNWAPKAGEVNAYTFTKTGKVKVKAVVKGFGKKDSKVVTRTFTVKKAKPAEDTTNAL